MKTSAFVASVPTTGAEGFTRDAERPIRGISGEVPLVAVSTLLAEGEAGVVGALASSPEDAFFGVTSQAGGSASIMGRL